MVVIGLVRTAVFLVDTWWVGWLGDEALAAMGGAAFAWWIVFIVCDVAGTGVHSIVSRLVGADQQHRVGPTIGSGLWVGAGLALALLGLLPFLETYFDVIGFPRGGAEASFGISYLSACVLGAGAFAAHGVINGVFRGLGDTRTALVITIGAFVLNAVADPVLMWGLGPVPGLGIAGAAWASALTALASAVAGGALLWRRGRRVSMALPAIGSLFEIVRIGAPVSAHGIAFSLVYVLLARFINSFGTEQVAALGVGHRLESLAFMICVGFEVGSATMVGQYIGAGDPRGAQRAARTAAKMSVLAMLPATLILFVFARPLFGFFANEPATVDAGVVYLQIQALFFVFMAVELAYEGAFTGTGHTVPAFVIGSVGTLLRIPLAWLLAWPLGMGVEGIWWAIAGSTAVKGVIMTLWFHRFGTSSSS